MKKNNVCGKGVCPDCGTNIGSALSSWRQHKLRCKPKSTKKKKDKQYWMCIIGGVSKEELGWGADGPLRMSVKKKFKEVFDKEDEVCASGWGIDEKLYEVLRSLHLISTDELQKMLDKYRKKQSK